MKTSPTKPRAADVARWVAILAAPLPSPFMRCDYRDARKAQTNARSALRSWGLRDDGTPLLAEEDYAYAAGVEAEVLAQRAAGVVVKRAYSTSTGGRNYVLHIAVHATPRTVCGRLSASVNCAGSDIAAHNQEELCKACVKTWALAPAVSS